MPAAFAASIVPRALGSTAPPERYPRTIAKLTAPCTKFTSSHQRDRIQIHTSPPPCCKQVQLLCDTRQEAKLQIELERKIYVRTQTLRTQWRLLTPTAVHTRAVARTAIANPLSNLYTSTLPLLPPTHQVGLHLPLSLQVRAWPRTPAPAPVPAAHHAAA